MPLRREHQDLVREPLRIAQDRLSLEREALQRLLTPPDRLRPVTRWLHDRGLTLKELSDG